MVISFYPLYRWSLKEYHLFKSDLSYIKETLEKVVNQECELVEQNPIKNKSKSL